MHSHQDIGCQKKNIRGKIIHRLRKSIAAPFSSNKMKKILIRILYRIAAPLGWPPDQLVHTKASKNINFNLMLEHFHLSFHMNHRGLVFLSLLNIQKRCKVE